MTNKEKFLSGLSFSVKGSAEIFQFNKMATDIYRGYIEKHNAPCGTVWHVDDYRFIAETTFLGTAVTSIVEFENIKFYNF